MFLHLMVLLIQIIEYLFYVYYLGLYTVSVTYPAFIARDLINSAYLHAGTNSSIVSSSFFYF